MVGRISFRWSSLPAFLQPTFLHATVENRTGVLGTRKTSGTLKCFILIAIIVIFLMSLFVTMNVHTSRRRRYTLAVSSDELHGEDSVYHYGIVVDCGSSGSRVFIYYWPPHNGNPDELLKIKQMKDSRGTPVRLKIKPGISTFVNKPSDASEYLRPLLDFAAEHVPTSKHKETPLYILATAGMRMLSKSEQDSILDDLRTDIPPKYNFHFTSSHAEVITGKQEGVYSWISVNFELGRFDHSKSELTTLANATAVDELHHKKTVGALDMGGGSAQIAFEVKKNVWVPAELLAEVNLGCDSHRTTHNYRLYVATFLGYGGNAARKRYIDYVLTNKVLPFDDYTGTYTDPCLTLEYIEKGLHNGVEYKLIGTGNFQKCQETLTPLLNLTVHCPRPPCSFNGVYQPPVDHNHSEFYGFSEYWYSMNDVLRIGGQYNSMEMQKNAAEFCRTRWTVLQRRFTKGLYPFADDHRLRFQCFKSAWMTSVLHEGFKFPRHFHNLRSAFYIGDKEVQWTLGAILYRTRFLPLREIEHNHLHSQNFSSYHSVWTYISELQFWLVFFVCSIIVVAFIVLYCRRLGVGRMSKASLSNWSYRTPKPAVIPSNEMNLPV